MSLFNLITWWSGQVSDSNQQGDNSLPSLPLLMCVSRFNSFDSATGPEKDTIFVGSATGMLSIYQPSDVYYVTGNQSPTDVILECQLNEPIIDLKCGKFAMTKSDKYTIAVLHPGRVACYGISFAEGLAEYGKQFQLSLAFEFNLHGSFSICKGSFGGVKSKEFFCCNHLAATHELRFFEQDGIATSGYLSPGERTLPSEMIYLSRIDCFAIFNMPNDILECYKYQDLITSTKEQPATPVWAFCVGEFVLSMATHQLTNAESVIVLLGEHNLICLTDGGSIKFIKKLDYTAITFHSFVVGYYFDEPDARLMIAIASDMESLFVYECNSVAGPINCKLIWSTQLPFVPVAFARANFEGMPGGLVLLSETGHINISFFGTDPQIFKVHPLNMFEDNNQQVEQVHRELETLEQDIKQGIDFTDVSFINAATERDLEVTIKARGELVASKPQMAKKLSLDCPKMACVQVKLSPKVPFEQIQIAVNPPFPLAAHENSVMFMGAEAGQDLEAEFWIYVSKSLDPPSLTVPVIISMISRQGVPRILEMSFVVSPELILKACTPQKETRYKLTLSVDSAADVTRDFLSLLPEFATDTINQQALGLQSLHSSKDIITIVLGKKNSNRFRLLSDSLSMLPVVAELLIRRLLKPSNTNPAHSSIKALDGISVNQSYFVEELVASINGHADCRLDLKQCDKEIQEKSRQMRLFQRKLNTLIQQDPPHPAYNSAGKLLRLTHADFVELQDRLLAAVDRLQEAQLILSNHMRLINLAINHCAKMPPQIKDNLSAVFVDPICDWIDMSWEQSVAPAAEMVAHVGALAKNKHGSSDIEDIKSFSRLPFDMDRLLKNLKYILEKLESVDGDELQELQARARPVVDETTTSDWLGDSQNSSGEAATEEGPSVNDMDLV